MEKFQDTLKTLIDKCNKNTKPSGTWQMKEKKP